MPSGSVRHALRRVVLAAVAVLFAATAAGRPSVAMAMAEQAMDHAARHGDDCSHQHQMPSQAPMPCGMACLCCPAERGGGAPTALGSTAMGIWDVPVLFRDPAPSREASPRAGVSVRQPPAIGPPSAPVA